MSSPAATDIFVEDTDSSVTYSGTWTLQPTNNVYYTAGTYHLTSSRGASASLAFTGSYVWFVSDMNDDHGVYSIALDGAPIVTQSSYAATLHSQQILFGTAVSPGAHTLTITNDDDNKALGIDQFVYRPVASSSTASFETAATSSFFPTTTSTSAPTSNSNHLPSGALAGIVLAVLATCILLVLLVVFLRDRRRRNRATPQYISSPIYDAQIASFRSDVPSHGSR